MLACRRRANARRLIIQRLATWRLEVRDGWIRTIEDARARGAYIGRIRLVGHPLTDYTRFELSAYTDNAAAGEDIRLIDRTDLTPSWNAAPDVWVFDDKRAITMRYSDDGAWLGFEECEAAPYVNVRRVLTPLAVPLAVYRPAEPPTSREPG